MTTETTASTVVAVSDDPASAATHAVVDDFLTMVPGRLLEAIEKHAVEDVTWQFPFSLTGGKVWAGKETVVRRLGRVLGNFEHGTMKIVRRVMIVSGTEASAEFDLTARGTNGLDYANTYVFFFSLRDDRIVAVREYMDTHVVLQLMA